MILRVSGDVFVCRIALHSCVQKRSALVEALPSIACCTTSCDGMWPMNDGTKGLHVLTNNKQGNKKNNNWDVSISVSIQNESKTATCLLRDLCLMILNVFGTHVCPVCWRRDGLEWDSSGLGFGKIWLLNSNTQWRAGVFTYISPFNYTVL